MRPLGIPFWFFLAVWLGVYASAQAQVEALTVPDHPRLFANAARFVSLKNQNDSVSSQLKVYVQRTAEQYLTADTIVYPTKGFKFGPMREVQGRIIALAMSYRLTGDQRFLTRARQELKQLAALPDWAPNHFLDVGEGALAAGIGLDWLYAELPPDERDQLARAIVENALLPSLEVSGGSGSWVDGDFNWTQVCHGGLTVGALAIAEREPELAKKIINRAIKNVPHAGAVYAPDGAYPEGPSYWSYGTTFHVLLIEALRSALGTSHGLETFPGFLKTADYNLQMVGPSGFDFNYSDYHLETQNEPIMLWFARETRRPDLARQELADVHALYRAAVSNTKSSVYSNRHTPFELLWWSPELAGKSTSTSPRHWTSQGVLPMAVMRSAWNDPQATFVAIKGGTPNHSHAHMDVGSFVLEADGVRWAIDLGTESYDKMRAAKLDLWSYAQSSTRWTTFRVGPEGHNILRFGGAYQNISGNAPISLLPAKNGSMGNSVDLTPVYRNQVERVQRNVTLNPDRSVSIEDQWTTGSQPVDVSWQWLTKAIVTRTPTGLLLRQDGQLLGVVIEPKGAIVEIQDVSGALALQDSPNPGVTRIVVKRTTAAGKTDTLRVKAIPGSVAAK
ncbi:heparinase II/III domain-containing protein [Spirosoma fluviale]|uniref:Heparinase II/III-like protein n=1 Tax=Spirosoma fluviale TaxID=1597977 RepID=A0A286GV28_9BACT|nr:heparinase II/III family protein [Spirosoma fluviale]SOD99388.1 Heparinase II/III-like protein [Spirosoma fluviale]